MREPVPDTATIPCHGCSRQVVLPGGPVRAAMRAGRTYVVFCTRRCNLTYIAREGTRQQEELARAGYSDADLSEGHPAGDQ
jgi:hypothetical protein